MYTSTKSFTLQCVSGETGDNYYASATETSIISQTDADHKAQGMAQTLAYELILCDFIPGVDPVVYYSVQKSASANNEAGYQTETFNVTLPAGAVYSTVSQAEADAAAEVAAQLAANEARDAGQMPIFTNLVQSWTGACPGGWGSYSVTITVNAGTVTSNVSESAASQAALESAQAQVDALLDLNCVFTYFSTAQSYTAECGGGEVGTPITVSNPEGSHTSVVSQADANAASLAAATAAAIALLDCSVGYWNAEQTYNATCLATYGVNWDGSDNSATVLANLYFSIVGQAEANAIALAVATAEAEAGLVCVWGGGIPPP